MPQEVQEHHRQAARIETLVQDVAEFSDPHARATAEELVQALLDMYGEGLARLLEITAETEASGLALIDTFASDELLSSLFLLHGLHPLDIETRVIRHWMRYGPISSRMVVMLSSCGLKMALPTCACKEVAMVVPARLSHSNWQLRRPSTRRLQT